MTADQVTKLPVEDVLLFTGQRLTDTAYNRYAEGVLNRDQLTRFYDVVRSWSELSERVLDEMHRMGIQG